MNAGLLGGVAVGLLAGAAVIVVLPRPRLALLLLVLVESSNMSAVFYGRFGISVYLATLALASATLLLGVVQRRVSLRVSSITLLAAICVLALGPSVVAARDPTVAVPVYVDLLKDVWFLFLVSTLAGSVSGAWGIARGMVATMAGLSALGLVNQFVLGGRATFGGFSVVSKSVGVGIATARDAGPFFDPNFWGRLLILALPLSAALIVEARQRGAVAMSLLWSMSALLLSGGLYLTGSRGALLGLFVAVATGLWAAGPAARRLLVLLPVAVLLLLTVPGVGSRLSTLTEVNAASSGLGDESLVERTAAQQISLAVFLDNATLGVGPANIPIVWNEYADRTDVPAHRVVAPHNLYLQLLAESGALGLVGWLILILGCLTVATRIVLLSVANGSNATRPERLLAAATIAALSGWAVASAFLHLSYLRPLLLVMAIVAVLDQQVHRKTTPTAARQRRIPLRSALMAAIVAVVLVDVSLLAVVRRPPVYVAQTLVTISPPQTVDAAPDAYDFDLLSRPNLMPTFAGVVRSRGERLLAAAMVGDRNSEDVELSVDGSDIRAVVTVQVRGRDQDEVRTLARDVARTGADYINRNDSLASLAVARPSLLTISRARDWSLG